MIIKCAICETNEIEFIVLGTGVCQNCKVHEDDLRKQIHELIQWNTPIVFTDRVNVGKKDD